MSVIAGPRNMTHDRQTHTHTFYNPPPPFSLSLRNAPDTDTKCPGRKVWCPSSPRAGSECCQRAPGTLVQEEAAIATD